MKNYIITAMAALTLSTAAVAEEAANIYNTKCLACHMTGVAGAPKVGDKDAWAKRMEKGIDEVLAVAKAGKGAMPPMGTCMQCSDDELKATIEYMIAK